MSEVWGVGGLAITEAGLILVFPPNPENVGKMEKVVGIDGPMEDIGPMCEGIGGAIDEGDWVGLRDILIYALMREAIEERGLDLSTDQIQLLPEGIEVLQNRELRDVNFLVACFVIQLSGDQELLLRQKGAVDLESMNDLRPRDRAMIKIYQKTIGIPVQVVMEEYA